MTVVLKGKSQTIYMPKRINNTLQLRKMCSITFYYFISMYNIFTVYCVTQIVPTNENKGKCKPVTFTMGLFLVPMQPKCKTLMEPTTGSIRK